MKKIFFYAIFTFLSIPTCLSMITNENITKIINQAKTYEQALNELKTLASLPRYQTFFQNNKLNIFNSLQTKFNQNPTKITNDWDQLKPNTNYLNLLPQELKIELAKYEILELTKEILSTTNKDRLTALTKLLKNYNIKAILSNDSLRSIFEHLAFRINKDDIESLISNFNLNNELKQWQRNECTFIANIIKGDYATVEKMINQQKIDKTASLLKLLGSKDSCKDQFTYNEDCDFAPDCYAKVYKQFAIEQLLRPPLIFR